MHSKKTFEYIQKGEDSTTNVWISQPGSGLEKRQCSLQVMLWPNRGQPKLAIIFRGQRKRISQDKGSEWHKGVNVYFQPNAWFHQNVCKSWYDEALLPFVKEQKLDKFRTTLKMLWLVPKNCFGMVCLVPLTFGSQLMQGMLLP